MIRHLFLLFALLACWPTHGAWAQEPEKTPAEKGLAKVFIIGDSISLGYTAPVTLLLEGKATVTRPNMNCQHTGVGLKLLEKWLSDGTYDVIHFNWGIWDTHWLTNDTMTLVPTAKEVDPDIMHIRHTPEEYAENLRKLVKTLKGTGAN